MPPNHVFAGVVEGRVSYHPASRVPGATTKHIFRVVVPKQRVVQVFIDSDLPVEDLRGLPIETKRTSAISLTTGNQDVLLFQAKIPLI